jgi:hypothetical protein
MSIPMRKGVKILCHGDLVLEKQKQNQSPTTHKDGQCVEVTIPADHPIYLTTPTSISTTMHLPLLLLTRPLIPIWSASPTASQNPSAAALSLNADPNSPDWGIAPQKWTKDVGSVLVVRQDGKDLTAFQVWALVDFCESYLKPEMEGAKTVHARKDIVYHGMSPGMFEKHLGGFVKEVLVEEDWEKVVSLYKV